MKDSAAQEGGAVGILVAGLRSFLSKPIEIHLDGPFMIALMYTNYDLWIPVQRLPCSSIDGYAFISSHERTDISTLISNPY